LLTLFGKLDLDHRDKNILVKQSSLQERDSKGTPKSFYEIDS